MHPTTVGTGADPHADLVLRGGVVHTLDDADTTGTAIAVRHGRILRVGSDAEVEHLKGFGADLIISGEREIADAMIQAATRIIPRRIASTPVHA